MGRVYAWLRCPQSGAIVGASIVLNPPSGGASSFTVASEDLELEGRAVRLWDERTEIKIGCFPLS